LHRLRSAPIPARRSHKTFCGIASSSESASESGQAHISGRFKSRAESRATASHRAHTHRACSVSSWHIFHLPSMLDILTCTFCPDLPVDGQKTNIPAESRPAIASARNLSPARFCAASEAGACISRRFKARAEPPCHDRSSGPFHLLSAYFSPPYPVSLFIFAIQHPGYGQWYQALIIAVPHLGHLMEAQGIPAVCAAFSPHFEQTQYLRGPFPLLHAASLSLFLFPQRDLVPADLFRLFQA
jgi:hypothetical protein